MNLRRNKSVSAALLLTMAFYTACACELLANGPQSRGKRMPLLGRFISHGTNKVAPETAAPSVEQSQKAPQPTEKRPQSSNLTFENLWDRWQSRVAENRSSEASTPATENRRDPAPPAIAAEPLEQPRPVPVDGEFPSFRISGNGPNTVPAMAPSVAAQPLPPPLPRPEPIGRPAVQVTTVPAPAAVPVSHEANVPVPSVRPATKVVLRPATEASSAKTPAELPAPVRSTSAYLNDGVRFGAVRRRSTGRGALDPTAEILDEEQKPSLKREPVEPQQNKPFEATFVPDDGSGRPQPVAVKADDLHHWSSPLPQVSADYAVASGGLDPIRANAVSPLASPAALQKTLHSYGIRAGSAVQLAPPTAPEMPQELEPTPAESPSTDEQADQQASVFGGKKFFSIDKTETAAPEMEPTPQPKRAQRQSIPGSVAGVDKTHRTILVVFPGYALPPVGSNVQVFQKIFFKRQLLAEFQVVDVQGNAVVASPRGKLDMDLILNGDEAIAQ